MNDEPHLGIDFGGVIMPIADWTENGDTSVSDGFFSKPPHSNAIQKILALVNVFEGNVWIVSKAGERTETLTRQWLHGIDFFRLTGLGESHLRFCRVRLEKKPICKELGITHFVDDKVLIMEILRETVSNLYLFGPKSSNRDAESWTTLVENWTEAYEAIAGDL